ncbi:aldose epimerase family protein [Notoacmeibacter marinus]|uniref:aldose epimerase family protein n=1 Tax=Notoacmeibacter marinus TaxID=1876515 RepID=UPI000DF32D67|nr:aldose epimerase family protein [Notoacmeibacter marinus]
MTTVEAFGCLPDGQSVRRITLANKGLTARILTYGATVQDLRLEGHEHPLVLGSPHLAPYLGPLIYAGSLVGRFSNRIAGGRFALGEQTFQLDRNEHGRHCLHGGRAGAGQTNWTIESVAADHAILSHELEDGHMGFPGHLRVEASFALIAGPALKIVIVARSDAPTPVSFAHHGYFNLDGAPTIADHLLWVDAQDVLVTDADNIATGATEPVTSAGLDFRKARRIGQQFLDHNFCLTAQRRARSKAAWLFSPRSRLAMTVETTEPGLQVYGGDHFPEAGLRGLDGRLYGPRAGIALETQAWPDAVNHAHFPDAILRPDQSYEHEVIYGFSTCETGDPNLGKPFG